MLVATALVGMKAPTRVDAADEAPVVEDAPEGDVSPTVMRSVRRLVSNRREQRGGLIALIGVAIVSMDALSLRLAVRVGQRPPLITMLFWRLAFIGVIVCLASPIVEKPPAVAHFRAAPKLLTAIVALRSISDVLLAAAIVLTYVANALLLYSTCPLYAAAGGRLLNDELRLRTVLAILGSVAAVLLMFLPRIVSGRSGGRVLGDILALMAALIKAITFIVTRQATKLSPEAPCVLLSGLGAVFGALILAVVASGSGIHFGPFTSYIVIMLLNGAVLSSTYVAFAVALRYTNAAVVSLIDVIGMLTLAPIWVFLAYDEVPPPWTIAGGVLLVIILLAHQYAATRDSRCHHAVITEYRSRRGGGLGQPAEDLLGGTGEISRE